MGLGHLGAESPFSKMNTEPIRTTRYDHANQYDNENVGLLIYRDKSKAFATIRVAHAHFKCVDVSRADAKAILITMRKGALRK